MTRVEDVVTQGGQHQYTLKQPKQPATSQVLHAPLAHCFAIRGSVHIVNATLGTLLQLLYLDMYNNSVEHLRQL
eukprot:1587160-Amphidinium_carterae.2